MACHGSGQIITDNVEGNQYHDRQETIALQIARSLKLLYNAERGASRRKTTQASCIRDVGSAQNFWLLAKRQTTRASKRDLAWMQT